MPISRLFAPSKRAKAARKPDPVILPNPMEETPSMVNHRRPRLTSSSDNAGVGVSRDLKLNCGGPRAREAVRGDQSTERDDQRFDGGR